METILSWLKEWATGGRKRFFWGMVIIIGIITWAVVPFFDATFFVQNRIAKRIDNLERLIAVEGGSVENNTSLEAEYDNIIDEINQARIVRENGIFYRNETTKEFRLKFIGGAFLGGLLAIFGLFIKEGNTFGEIIALKFFVIVVGLILGAILGYLFAMLPVIFSAWVNLILAPIIQIIIIALLE